MRKIRAVLRLYHEAHQSRRAIARSLCLSRDAVGDYLTRANAAGLSWPLPPTLDDAELEQRLFPPCVGRVPARKVEPDWATVHQELKKKGATLQVLHLEYLSENPDGMAYSLFCMRHREFARTLKRYMRQVYVAGERVFVDYAGPTVPIVDVVTGTTRLAQIFAGVLGASSCIYAEAHWSQRISDWIGAHVRMFEHFGAVPAVIVCDNLKSAVTRASRTEPIINASYQAMAEHYGTVIVPARPRQPKDKAKAENGVLIIERWILFRLRKRVFSCLSDLNDAIRELLLELNARPFQKLKGCRNSLFTSLDKPAMRALPESRYEYAEFRRVRVGMDYCIDVNGCSYSVPFGLSRQEVDVRITGSIIEVLHQGRRVASHMRSDESKQVIAPEHMETNHRHFGLWDTQQALAWADQTGPFVRRFTEALLAGFRTREQGYRLHTSLKKLAGEYGATRLNSGCERAIQIGATSLASVRSILRNNLDKLPLASPETHNPSPEHPNVRGPGYYL